MGQADVLAVLRAGGPMTAREIAEHLPWSPSVSDNSRIGVVNKALRKLRRDGLVESYGPSPQMHRATGGGERMNGLEALKALREDASPTSWWLFTEHNFEIEEESE